MIIHPPKREDGQQVRIWAKIELSNSKASIPNELWFEVPGAYSEYVTDNADAFLIALLPTAMFLGEDIEVRSPISSRLAYGLQEFQHILSAWWPGECSIANIRTRGTESRKDLSNKGATGCSFSGGVDSTFSLWRHLAEKEPIPNYRITHCLMVNGFDHDVDLEDSGYFRNVLSIYKPMLDKLSVELVTIKHNLQQFRFLPKLNRKIIHTYPMPLIAAGMIFSRLFSRFYIPAAMTYDTLVKEGAHPMLEHWLSTESMEIIVDGLSSPRVHKTLTLAQWPETYNRLRVCAKGVTFDDAGAIVNCCACEKCVRTMTTLDIVGALDSFTTFPQPLLRSRIRNSKFSGSGIDFANENIGLAQQHGRTDIVRDLRLAQLRSSMLRQVKNKAIRAAYENLSGPVKKGVKKLISLP